MAKMFDYPDKIGTQVNPDLDYLIITNGAEEYNIKISEFFNVHKTATSHDHSSFKIESEIRDYARQEASTLIGTAITNHETTYEHLTSLEVTALANLSSSAAITQHLLDAQHGGGGTGFTGEIYDDNDNLVIIDEGSVISVEDSVWYDALPDLAAGMEFLDLGTYHGKDYGIRFANFEDPDTLPQQPQ